MTAVVLRCENWGNVMRWRINAAMAINSPTHPGAPARKHYFAAERGFYTSSPQIWEAVPTPPPDPDQRDAADVESAVQSMDLYHHAVLRYHHVNRLEGAICLRLAAKAGNQKRGQASGFASTLAMSHALLIDALKLPAVIRKARALERVAIVLKAFSGNA